jgi:hypothetical protein
MTRSSAPASQDLYLAYLPQEAQRTYRSASSETDLAGEIRLIRTVLCHMATELPGSDRAMTAILGVLVRAVALQAKQSDGTSDVERALLDAAAMVLKGEPDGACDE